MNQAVFQMLAAGICAAWAAGPAADSPKTYTVRRAPLHIEVTLEGLFEAEHMAPVRVEPEEWESFVVARVVPQGREVTKGEPLLWFDAADLDEQIKDLEADKGLAETGIGLTEKEIALLEASTPFDIESSRRDKQIADEELGYFVEKGLPLAKQSAEFALKNAEYRVEYAQEELNQLKKMYEADDLTEETEEIVLKRAQRDVENAKQALEQTRARTERTLGTELPRQQQNLTRDVTQKQHALQRAETTLPLQLTKKHRELEKARHDRRKADQRLEKLLRDREQHMILEAPADGIVYYGKCHNGSWSGREDAAGKLVPRGKVGAHETIMTIVQPRPMFIRLTVPEDKRQHVTANAAGSCVPKAFPNQQLPVRVQHVSPIPVREGHFDARASVELGMESAAVMPGMQCTVKLVPYTNASALVVPGSAIEQRDGKSYARVVVEGGEPEEREVTLGMRTADTIEIRGGLAEGDKILLDRNGETQPPSGEQAPERKPDKNGDPEDADKPKD